MAYFGDLYSRLRLPIAEGDKAGLRRAQLGAIHAIAGHFSVRSEAALVSMPTGTGKSAVICAAPFFLRTNRVLIVAPSTLIRNQLYDDFRVLGILKRLGVLAEDVPCPRVAEVKKRLVVTADWEALADFDVVVATPHTIGPDYTGLTPPADLFDLVLVDEAHHSPARTWQSLLDAFPGSRRALFTATPFRQDRKEVRGHIVYHYPLREARKDQVYGPIRFVPLALVAGQEPDATLAVNAERILREDRANGHDHYLMVRTDRIPRAKELEKVYEAATSLRLRLVTGQHSFGRVKQAIDELRKGQLDGIICVDLFGEGFDFPNFKVAAIHAPHRSLGVTLQFIGRFSRSGSGDVGEAKFLAFPEDVRGETAQLFEEDAVWEELVVNLSEGRLQQEQEVRETLGQFSEPVETTFDTETLSLYALTPFCHVKIYRVFGDVDIARPLSFDEPLEVIYRRVSADLNATVVITKETERKRWTSQGDLARIDYDLFVIFYDVDSKLLFINSSRRSRIALYESIAEQLRTGEHAILSAPVVNRVLRGVDGAEFFNVGMKSRSHGGARESYRILTGPGAQRAISPADARSHARGHVYGRGVENGENVTIGLSTASKVWSNRNIQIPLFLRWCRALAKKLTQDSEVRTGSQLDILAPGAEVDRIPGEALAADWGQETYQDPPIIVIDGQETHQLLDGDLVINRTECTVETIRLTAEWDNVAVDLAFSPRSSPMMRVLGMVGAESVQVSQSGEMASLDEYLNEQALYFYLADGSQLSGNVHTPTSDRVATFETDFVEIWQWPALGVDIENECSGATAKGRSIQECLGTELAKLDCVAVFCDHGKGEMADFIAVWDRPEKATVRFYHCKGSSEAEAGARLEDFYEACGQALKCRHWLSDSRMIPQVRYRAAKGRSRFLKGTLADLEHALRRREEEHRYEVVIVQPGLSKKRLSTQLSSLLGVTSEAIYYDLREPLRVIASE